MKLSTTTRVAMAALVSASLLAACSNDAGPGGETTGDETTAGGGETSAETGTDDTAAAGDQELTLWLAGETDTPVELEEWLVTTFEEQNEGATLTVQRIPWGELLDRANQALPDPENTPDVIELGNTQVPAYTSVGAFTDLSGLLEELGDIGPEGFIEAGTYDGKAYALPYYWGSRYVFYDKDAFQDAGVEVPTTLEELSTAAAELRKAGGDDYAGFWLPGQDWRNGISWIFAHGGDIATLDGDQWTGKLSSPESVEGLEQWQQLYADASTAPVDGKDAEPWVPFNNEEAAMFMAPSWAAGTVDEARKDALGGFALPGVDGGAAPVFAGGSNIAISAQSQHQDLSMELLRLIYSDDFQKMLAENGLGPANPEFTSLMGDDEFATAAIDAAANAKLTPASPNWAAVETAGLMEEFFGQIAAGDDVESAAEAADAELESILNG